MSGEERLQQLAAAPKGDGAQWTKEQALEWLANAEAADVELTADDLRDLVEATAIANSNGLESDITLLYSGADSEVKAKAYVTYEMVTRGINVGIINNTEVGQLLASTDVDVRILSLDVDAAPEVESKLLRVAPEVSVDQLTGQSYYEAEVRLTAAALSSLPADASLPGGTPVEAHLQLGDRTVLAYLVGPFLERLTKAMREP